MGDPETKAWPLLRPLRLSNRAIRPRKTDIQETTPLTRRYIIIIGAMKSGTTTLFDVLATHPQIVGARYKEPGFFAFEDVWARGFEWFDTLFDYDPARHAYRLEASTDYTKAPFVSGVLERMTANPDVEVKLLYIMRDPLRRIESHARHVQRTRKELGQQISPRHDHSLDAGLSPINLAASLYATQLDQFRTAFETGQLHCLTLEGLRADPAGTLADVYRFLGLEEPAGSHDSLPKQNAAAGKTQIHPLLQKVYKNRPLMSLGRTLLPQSLRNRVNESARCQIRLDGRFRLTPEEEAFLSGLLTPERARLREVYRLNAEPSWTA